MKPEARSCKHCKKQLGCFAMRYTGLDGKWHRDYFHPNCFKSFVAIIDREFFRKSRMTKDARKV